MPKRKALTDLNQTPTKATCTGLNHNYDVNHGVDLTKSDGEGNFHRPTKGVHTHQYASNGKWDPNRLERGRSSSELQSSKSFRSEEWGDEDKANQLVGDSSLSSQSSQHLELYGDLKAKVVGIQYYTGVGTKGEVVLLRREPRNPYDRNAIRVDNVLLRQIGHIPREMAAKLAPYMDKSLLVLEARLADDQNTYSWPLTIQVYGPGDEMEKAQLKDRLARDRLPVEAWAKAEAARKRKEEAARKKEDAARKKAEKLAALGTVVRNGASLGSSQQRRVEQEQQAGYSAFYQSSNAATEQMWADIMESTEFFNPREVSEVVEKYGVNEETLKNLPLASTPQRLVTSLLPYQQQGLAWLLDKENPQVPAPGSDEIVQLWKRSGVDKFTNIATNFSLKASELQLASGGILADDMGLGKTLQVISLIVSTLAAPNAPQEKGKTGATLIVAPLGVMSNWCTQIEEHVDEDEPLRILVYHGTKRLNLETKDFQDHDVVITTYGTLATDYSPSKSTGLFAVHWRRVVLDEGHNIRNPRTKCALAAYNLLATSKWVLTGTPIINTLKDLYSLVKFIGLNGGLQEFEVFNRTLIRGVKTMSSETKLLLQALMATICLRRRKDMSIIDLKLPDLVEYVHHVQFTASEAKRYDALNQEAKGVLRDYQIRQQTKGTNAQAAYQTLLEVLLRLRQVCNHWKLCEQRVQSVLTALSEKKEVDNKMIIDLQQALTVLVESRETCTVCFNHLTEQDSVITACRHAYHRNCIAKWIEERHACPLCRAGIEDDAKLICPSMESEDTNDDDGVAHESDDHGSSKVTALLTVLKASFRECGTKVVVFSQWCRFLNLVQPHLDAAGYEYVRLDGTMSAAARDTALNAFAKEPDTTILLASLGVCSVGLNLTAANTVILCDSWWAPAIEDQAVDRVHRLGQTRKCTVWRLVMKDSIEERTIAIQAEKRKLMAEAFQEGEDARKGKEGRIGDIERLLS